MLDYKQLLFKSLDLLLTGWEVEPDSDGDIHLTIPEYKELDQEYPDFLSFLKSLPQIHQHQQMVRIYLTDGDRTYKHLINPTPEYIASQKHFYDEN